MMATRAGTGPTRRWPRFAVVLGAVLVAVALVAVYFALKPAPAPTATPPPPTPTDSRTTDSRTTPSASVSGAPTVLADGCLGGTDPIKAIRIAHETAPLTPEGAAAFVATLARWQGQVPHDPTEYQQTGKLIWAPSLPATNRATPAAPPGATAWVSTVDARYRVADVTGKDITIEGFFTQTGTADGVTNTVEHVGRFTVTDVNGHWAYEGVTPPAGQPETVLAELRAEGLPYRGGC